MTAAIGTFRKLGMNASSTTSTEMYEVTGFTPKVEEQLINADGMRGTRSKFSERTRQGVRSPGWSATLQPNPTELDNLLPRILGGSASGDTFPLAETLPSFVTNVEEQTERWHYTGCAVGSAVFRCSQGQNLELQLAVEALDVVQSATAFPALSVSTQQPYVMSDLVVTVGGTGYQFRDFELSIDNGLLIDRFFMSQTRISLPAADRTVSISLNGPYGDNSALYGLAVAGVAVVATFTNGSSSLTLSMPAVQFPRIPPAGPGREEIMLPLQGMARKSGSTNELVVTNVNA